MFEQYEEYIVFLPIKKSHLMLVKKGRISIHETTSKGKKYVRGKIYLRTTKILVLGINCLK